MGSTISAVSQRRGWIVLLVWISAALGCGKSEPEPTTGQRGPLDQQTIDQQNANQQNANRQNSTQAATSAPVTVDKGIPQPTPGQPPKSKEEHSFAMKFGDRAFGELDGTRELIKLNQHFTIELWVRWSKPFTRTQYLLSNDIAPSNHPDVSVESPRGWVLVAEPKGDDAFQVKFLPTYQYKPSHETEVVTTPKKHTTKWRHIVVNRRSNDLRVMIDGQTDPITKLDPNNKLVSGVTPIYIGPRKYLHGQRRFDGEVRSLRITAAPRYPEPFIPSTEAWQPDKFTLLSIDFSKGNAQDSSGRGHHAKLFGASWVSIADKVWSDTTFDPEKFEYDPVTNDRRSIQFALGSAGVDVRRGRHLLQARLRGLSPHLQEITPSTPKKDLGWQKVTFGDKRTVFNAFRFRSPFDKPADLVWALALPNLPGNSLRSWYIAVDRGEFQGFRNFKFQRNIQVAGIKLPSQNRVIFQRLLGGQIKPNREYFIYTVFERRDALDGFVNLKLVPEGTSSQDIEASAVAAELSIGPLPFQKHDPSQTPEGLINRAKALAQRRDMPAALTVLDQLLAKYPDHRQGLIYAINANVARGRSLMASVGIKAGLEYFNKASKYALQLRDSARFLSESERRAVQAALYNEAGSFAVNGKTAEALSRLRIAIDEGLREYDALAHSDTRLVTLREMDEFKLLVRDTRATYLGSIFHLWRDTKNNRDIEAYLLDVEGATVTLREFDGKELTIDIGDLDESGQAAAKSWLEKKKQLATRAPQP